MKSGFKFLFSILLFTLFSISVKAQKTNVVVILIDDLSHYGVSAYGATHVGSVIDKFIPTTVSTPSIDKLAQEGVLCNNAFAYPLCEATRIAFMSGQTNNQNYLRCKSQHASDITFGDTFQKAGYTTGMYGKWKQTRGTKAIHAKGYISEFGWDDYCCFDVIGEGQRFINPNLVVNGKVEDYKGRTDLDPETGRRWYGPDICNRAALDFIETNKDKPFFLYYPMLLVHDDHKPTPDTKPNALFDNFDEANNNKNGHTGDDHRYFPDMIRYMDKLIGQVVHKIDSLGLRENTLIVVMGDNGTKECFSHIFNDGKVYPGRKGGNADNGLHVPLVLSYPKVIPAAKDGKIRRYDGLVNLTDIYPTIAEATGVEIPNEKQIDGISFWNQAKGATSEHRDYIYTWYVGNKLYTEKDELLEYVFNKDFKWYAPAPKFPKGRFFDLRTDSLERFGDYSEKKGWGILQYSGINDKDLTKEQRSAKKQLKKLLEKHKMKPVTGLKIRTSGLTTSGDAQLLAVGSKAYFNYSVAPKDATRQNVVWVSNNPSVLTVDKFGVVTALKQGNAKVSIYSWDDAFPQASNSKVEYLTTGISDVVDIEVQ